MATAIQLRFDSQSSSLPADIKARILTLRDSRISEDGIIIITAKQFRTQEANRKAALERLDTILQKVLVRPKRRKATKPTRASTKKRLDTKSKHAKLKKLRAKIDRNEE